MRAFAWVASLLVIAWLAAMMLDFVWFRTMVPISFTSARWSGVWRTHQYMGMSGRLLVHPPDPLPEDEEFKAEELEYYPIRGVWKTGQFVRMAFVGGVGTGTSSGESAKRAGGRPALREPKKERNTLFQG